MQAKGKFNVGTKIIYIYCIGNMHTGLLKSEFNQTWYAKAFSAGFHQQPKE